MQSPSTPPSPNGAGATTGGAASSGTPAPELPAHWAFVCHSSSCRYQGAEETTMALATSLRDAASAPATATQPPATGLLGALRSMSAGLGSGAARAAEPASAGFKVAVARTGCLGFCSSGPVVVTYPASEVHLRVSPSDARELAGNLRQGKGLARRAVSIPAWYRDSLRASLGRLANLLTQRLRGG